jgi:DNA-binding MarR family transcriptional regulator
MLAVLVQFRDVVRAMRNHYRLVERAIGISGACVWAMAELESAPGLRISELAAQLAIHQSTASNLVERLAAAGLVERRSDADRRVAHVYLTRRGRLALQRAPPPQRGVLQEALSRLPLPVLLRLRRDLDTLRADIDSARAHS